jgi:UDP-3-O-[3-hydroxymyristoyl] N-acetylglucosamine deacetylase
VPASAAARWPAIAISSAAVVQALKSVMGRPQQTLAVAVSRSGVGLHSGPRVTATLIPTHAGEGRYFLVGGAEEARLAAEVGNAEPRSCRALFLCLFFPLPLLL